MTKFWNIASNVADDSVLNMYVYGNIVTNSNRITGSPDDVVTREIIKDLNAHPQAKRINVYINSGGGEVFAAVAMGQQLKKHKAEVHTYVDGVCASAATLIALAGDVRHMTVSSLFMVHLPSTSVQGNKYTLDKGKEVLQKVEDIIRLTYKDKSNLSDDELTALIDHESWLTADEAYTYGFITDIEEAPDAIDNLIKEVTNDVMDLSGVELKISAYAEPDQIRAKLTAIQNSLKKKEEGGIFMDFQAFMNSLPVDRRAEVTAEMTTQVGIQTATLTTQVTDFATQVEALTAQLATSNTTLESTQNELVAAQEAIKAASASSEDADVIFLNSLPVEAKQAILDARKIATDATAALAVAKDADAYAQFVNKIGAYENLPVQDTHIKALFNLSRSCPEDFNSIEELFKVANTSMEGQFAQKGTDGEGASTGDTAYDQIERLVKDARAADPALDYNTAFGNVCKANPDLYNNYRDGE